MVSKENEKTIALDSLFSSLRQVQNQDSLKGFDTLLYYSDKKIFFNFGDYFAKLYNPDDIILYFSSDTLLAKSLFRLGCIIQQKGKEELINHQFSPLPTDSIFQQTGKTELALKFFSRLNSIFPENQYGILAQKHLADIYFAKGDYFRAKLLYWNFVFYNTDMREKEEAFFQIERCKYYLGSYEFPTEMFHNYITKFPQSRLTPRLRFDLGIYYYNVEKKNKALYELEKILSLHPQVSWADSVYYQIAVIYKDFREWNKSIDVITKMIKKFPESKLRQSGFALLSKCFLSQQSLLDAINKLNAIISEIPERKRNEYYQILAELYKKVGLSKEVLSIYNLMLQNEVDSIRRDTLKQNIKKFMEKTGHISDELELFDTRDTEND